jgi:PAS domain S-box-containing protein
MNFSNTDSKKTKQQLIDELNSLRHRLGLPKHVTSGSNEELVSGSPISTLSILSQRQELLSKAFELTTDAIIFVDDKLRISHFNQGAENTFGYSADEVIGQPLNILLPKAFRANHNEHLRAYANSHEPSRSMNDRSPIMGQTKDGKDFPAKVTITRIQHNGTTYLTAFLRDISEIKKMEDETKKVENELAHVSRVSTLAEVSSSLAHELNQPLAAILTNAQVLQRLNQNAAAKLDSTDEIITDLIDDAYRASEVIKRIRALLKPQAGHVEIVDLNVIVADVEQLLRSEIIMRQVSLSTELANDLPAVMADRIQLQQVLINFMTNAFDAMEKIDPGDRRIMIRTRQVSPIAAEVCFMDNGIGLPQQSTQQIFNPFFTTKKHGLGMGLAISKTLLQAQGERIWAENNPDGGAAFYFTVKLVAEDEAEGVIARGNKQAKSNDGTATVYIVDDDPSLQKAMKRLISSAGYNVEVFGSAQEFMQRNERHGEPACLVADLHMPSVTGLDLQKQLNSREYTIPIIFLTGAGNTAAGVQAIKQGALDFLSKPVDGETILSIIARAIEIDRQARARHQQNTDINGKLLKLTAREREVLDLVVKGLMNKQIAYELGIAEKTVKAHRGQMMLKMKARSLAGLVHLMESLTEPPPPTD